MADPASSLCLACGLCCNGVLFKDVELQPGDDAGQLQSLGLPVTIPRSARRAPRFPQPCAALGADCRCQIYAERPARCRQFECSLLQLVTQGKMEMPAALRTIRQTRQRAERVRGLLRSLGDQNESLALSLRFQRLKRRLESSRLDEATADAYGELTLAVHDLNVILRAKFYP